MAMAATPRARRGPAPIASFDHDVSDESSPETKQTFQLPEIREGGAAGGTPTEVLERPASASAGGGGPAGAAGGGLATPAAPRIDISRASSSSHHDSRDSSPELALFAGGGEDARGALHLAFREEGAAELRSSTEELAFLEAGPAPAAAAPPPPPASASACASRRHSRKDSQSSEVALLAVSGRTSRVSSVGSHCSALSAVSRVSRLSAVSGLSRSPSPHKMLLETSFCGPKPIETDPEICAAAVEERLLEIVKMSAPAGGGGEGRGGRRVRTAATVETAPRAPPPPAATPPAAVTPVPDADKTEKENRNRARVEERRARSRERREPSQPEVYKPRNKSKDIIRIKLKPKHEYDEDDDEDDDEEEDISRPSRPTALSAAPAPAPAALSPTPSRRSISPAAGGGGVSRKSSFCSLFKSRETIGSPDSPSDALRRKKSLNEGRSRSKSRDSSATPSSAGKLRGSVLSLFKTSKRGTSPSPTPAPHPPDPPPPERAPAERLKYYENGGTIIHIPLRTPPDEPAAASTARAIAPRPASAPPARPVARTVLPDGSIIIPLHSPTESAPPERLSSPEGPQRRVVAQVEAAPAAAASPAPAAAPPATPTSPPVPAASSESPPSPAAPSAPPAAEAEQTQRRRERLMFTTQVGSGEQVFSTQFSITKTPSVASEMSESAGAEEARAGGSGGSARDSSGGGTPTPHGAPAAALVSSHSLQSERSGRSSSSPECVSPVCGAGAGAGAEERVLVVQDSFEEELPYVPTTLPQERPRALPMVPIRDRPAQSRSIASVERPRSGRAKSLSAPPPPPPAAPPPRGDKLRIHLPRRGGGTAARARSDSAGAAPVPPADWVDFAELPERRKQPRRIQTLPAEQAPAAAAAAARYAPPEECRCECHALPAAPPDRPPDRSH